jgi:SAM-dependent methyltransferase
MSTAPFDPLAYKRATTDQWQVAAEPWHRWAPTLEAWLGEATETMLDMAGVVRAARVLDVAAGAGGQTLAAARRVGPEGHVLATEITTNILAFAERSAGEAGLRNVETRVVDGEQLDVQPGTFDAVISRVGFIYFPDQHGAFVGMRLALRPGGRLAGIVYTTPEANEFFSIPVSIIRRRAQLPAPAQGQPGPFSLGAPGVLEAALERAGFSDVETRRVAAPLWLPSTAEFVRFARESFGALHQMLAGLANPSARRRGARSGASSHGTRRRTASRAPASCSSPPVPLPRSYRGRIYAQGRRAQVGGRSRRNRSTVAYACLQSEVSSATLAP